VTDDSVTLQIDAHLYQTIAPANTSDVVLCGLCSALVYNKAPSRAHHLAWHERLVPGSTGDGGPADAGRYEPVEGTSGTG
jgi:hypothetical protein